MEPLGQLSLVDLSGLFRRAHEGVLHLVHDLRGSALALSAQVLESCERPGQGGRSQFGVPDGQERGKGCGMFAFLVLELGHAGNEGTILLSKSGIGIDGCLEPPLVVLSFCDLHRVVKSTHDTCVGFEGVLETKDSVSEIHLSGFFGMTLSVVVKGLHPGSEEIHHALVAHIPPVFQLSHGLEPGGGPGVPDHKDQVAIGDPFLAEGEIVLCLEGLPVLVVDPVKGHVQVVAGECEVVPVTAEVCQLKLRRKDEPQVGVAFEDID